jgi:hypothetical protein
MYNTLLEKVKANIDERKVEANQDRMLLRGWSFSEEHGVCPVRCKYESTIKGVDIELRKDVCDHFGRNNLILSGWKIYVPLNKYVDFQIKLGNDWVTFVSTNTMNLQKDTIESTPMATPLATPMATPVAPTTTNSATSLSTNMIIQDKPADSVRISLATQPSPLSHLFVVDQFYQYPEEVRNFGLSIINTGKVAPSFPPTSPLKGQFETILGRKIRSFQEWKENGQFALTSRSSPIAYEVNRYQYGGIVFLTPNAPVTSGITLYRTKSTKQQKMDEQQFTSLTTDQLSTELEPVDIVGNVYNRLVLFNTNMIHAISHHFGKDTSDSRLVQTFAFDLD